MDPQIPEKDSSVSVTTRRSRRKFLGLNEDLQETEWVGNGVPDVTYDVIPCGISAVIAVSTSTHSNMATNIGPQASSTNIPSPPKQLCDKDSVVYSLLPQFSSLNSPRLTRNNSMSSPQLNLYLIDDSIISKSNTGNKISLEKESNNNNNEIASKGELKSSSKPAQETSLIILENETTEDRKLDPEPTKIKITEIEVHSCQDASTSKTPTTSTHMPLQDQNGSESVYHTAQSSMIAETEGVTPPSDGTLTPVPTTSSTRTKRKVKRKNTVKAQQKEEYSSTLGDEVDENPFSWITSTTCIDEFAESDDNPFSWITAEQQEDENQRKNTTPPINTAPSMTEAQLTDSILSVIRGPANTETCENLASLASYLDGIMSPKSVTFDNAEAKLDQAKIPPPPKKSSMKVTKPKPKKKPPKSKESLPSTSKKSISELPEPPSRSITVTSLNTRSLNSDYDFSHVVVSRCRAVIPPTSILKTCGNLSSLTFQHLLRFQNALNFMRTAYTTLTILNFIDVSIQKQGFPTDTEALSLPCLKELNISCMRNALADDEYWLLQYFGNVETVSLRKITFEGVDRAEHISPTSSTNSPSTSSTSVQQARNLVKASQRSMYGIKKFPKNALAKNAALAHFLIKKRASLKSVCLGGDGCKLFDTPGSDIDPLKELQLESVTFGMNTKGIELVLKHQKSLRELTCRGFTRFIRSVVQMSMCKCIERNWATLEAVGIFPCVIGNGCTNDLYALSCGIFVDCTKLERLYANITCAKSENAAQLAYGTILGMESLPETLVQIEIYTDAFLRRQLELFAKNFSKFLNLQRLVLSSSYKQRYSVMPSWIRALLDLPNIRSVDFFGGKVENKVAVEEILSSKRNQGVAVTYHPKSISFYISRH